MATLPAASRNSHAHPLPNWPTAAWLNFALNDSKSPNVLLMTSAPVLVPDVSADPRYIKVVEDARSELVIPLLVKDRCIGVFDLESPELDAFNKRYRTLKTVLLESLDEGAVKRAPEWVKMTLLEKYRDLPNPATYRCEVDIEFPYQETTLPVAKRKLMAQLVS